MLSFKFNSLNSLSLSLLLFHSYKCKTLKVGGEYRNQNHHFQFSILQVMASSSSSSSSNCKLKYEYDVFLSFRGEDTRKCFTDHLYNSLIWKGITVFRDEEEIQQGFTISSRLLSAIEASRIAVVVLSKNYASSSWCLDELDKIIQCKEESGMDVIPVFYEIEASDVRKQKGTFAEAFKKHQSNGVDYEKLQKWRNDLTQVAGFKGWDSKNWLYETKLIEDICEEIWKKIRPTMTCTRDDLVGIDSKYNQMLSLLDLKSDGVVLVGIWGMGGIGKSTLASFLFDRIKEEFEFHYFLSDMEEKFQKHSLPSLQRKLLSRIYTSKVDDIWDAEGFAMIEKAFFHKKVLLVLNDVDDVDQIERLISTFKSSKSGSRIIITTRNEDFFQSIDVERRYKVEELHEKEALQLLHLKAFPKSHLKEGYSDLCKSIIRLVGGNPLALRVLGSSLRNRDVGRWKWIIEELNKSVVGDDKIFKVLKISYDGLDEKEKEIFLDIACFFKGEERGHLVEILDGRDFGAESRVELLIQKSLITLYYGNRLGMHRLLRDMGKKIERQKDVQNRLWCYDDVNKIFKSKEGIRAIQSIFLPAIPKVKITNFFSEMYGLRLLNVEGDVMAGKYLDCVPMELRYVRWYRCPLEFLPLNSEEYKLIELDMWRSNLRQLWKGDKCLEKLKYIDSRHSQKLLETPDFSRVPNLERFDLEGCTSLRKIHPSIFMARKLRFLNLANCKNLLTLPSCINMEALESLNLAHCSKLKKIPEFSGNTERLSEMYLDHTAIRDLPESVASLNGLTLLRALGCKELISFPSSILQMKSLKSLDLSGCSKLWSQQEDSDDMEELDVRGIAIVRESTFYRILKYTISGLLRLLRQRMPWFSNNIQTGVRIKPSLSGNSSLIQLNLSDCNLRSIPDDIFSLSSLCELILCGNNFSSLPMSISHLTKLHTLDISGCKKLISVPKLPPNISILRTKDCISLKEFPSFSIIGYNRSSNLSLNLSNCWELMLNTEEKQMLLLSNIKALIQERSRVRMNLPGSEVPNWFRRTKIGSLISFEKDDLMFRPFMVCLVDGGKVDSVEDEGSSCCDSSTMSKTHVSVSIPPMLDFDVGGDTREGHIRILAQCDSLSKYLTSPYDTKHELKILKNLRGKECGFYSWNREDSLSQPTP